jgi:hypothetical protein
MPLSESQPQAPELRLAHPDPRYVRPRLIEPSTAGFVYFAVQTDPAARPGPVRGRDPRRARALALVSEFARATRERLDVRAAQAFRAVLAAPGEAAVRPDVAVLMQTGTLEEAVVLKAAPELERLSADLAAGGARTAVLAARNVRRIADVDHGRGGLFLFNHFRAPDPELALALWERLAAWYERETGLDNSMLLAPVAGERSEFALVNHARWDAGVPTVLWHQIRRRSFRTFVRANLRAHGVTAIPILYRAAGG